MIHRESCMVLPARTIASRVLPVLLMAVPGVAAAQAPTVGPLKARVGMIDGDQSQVFGWIADIVADRNDNLYLADEYGFDVRVFDPDGRLLGRAGRQGSGPGEFQEIRSMAVASDGTLYVLDVGNGRIATFQLGGSGLAFRATIPLHFSASQMCVLRDRLFVLAVANSLSPGGLIREVDRAGRIVRVFGEREQPAGALRRVLGDRTDLHNAGRLWCHEATGTIVLMHSDFALVRAFTTDGREIWRTTLRDWNQQRYERSPDGGCCTYNLPNPRSGTYHLATAVGALSSDQIFIALREFRPLTAAEWQERRRQAARTGGGTPEQRDITHEVRVLEAKTGREVGRTIMNVEGGVAYMTPEFVYTYDQRPYPRAWIYSRRQ
jgi:hypothetical protein